MTSDLAGRKSSAACTGGPARNAQAKWAAAYRYFLSLLAASRISNLKGSFGFQISNLRSQSHSMLYLRHRMSVDVNIFLRAGRAGRTAGHVNRRQAGPCAEGAL